MIAPHNNLMEMQTFQQDSDSEHITEDVIKWRKDNKIVGWSVIKYEIWNWSGIHKA